MTLVHTPPENENDKRARAAGILADHQLRLGDNVEVPTGNFTWVGFIVSIDRARTYPDVLVQWSVRPAGGEKDGYSLFQANHMVWDESRSTWQADPTPPRENSW